MDTLWLGAKNEHHFIPLVSKVYVRFIRNITIFDKLKRVDKFILLKSTFIIWFDLNLLDESFQLNTKL